MPRFLRFKIKIAISLSYTLNPYLHPLKKTYFGQGKDSNKNIQKLFKLVEKR